MKTLLSLLLLIPISAFALDIDEKLTIRVIKASETKKTLLVNRGTEDGLVEGDHAKFLVTAGIVARAVCAKVSPTRSVWSVYRLVNSDFILNDSVMTLKITPPVKVTKDESQALVQEDTPSRPTGDPETLGIPLADGAQDINTAEEKMSDADLKSLEENHVPASLIEKNREVFGIVNFSGLSATSKTDSGSASYKGSQSSYHLGLGGEYYPVKERQWYSRFSLLGTIAMMKENSMAYNGAGVTNDLTEFSVGANWHPFTPASSTGALIPFFHFDAHMGTVKSTYKHGTELPASAADLSSTGTTSGFSLGFGYKFYTHKGFGARAMLDYYTRAEKYKEDQVLNSHNKTVVGPRLMLGISYRF